MHPDSEFILCPLSPQASHFRFISREGFVFLAAFSGGTNFFMAWMTGVDESDGSLVDLYSPTTYSGLDLHTVFAILEMVMSLGTSMPS